MTGRLRNSFRSGNLAEDLGMLLLKDVAAVAEVSRQEDIGLDAIATLLRPDDDGNSYAEDSFVVQLKSESTKTLEYHGHELKWLVGQQQPMFIGLVSLERSRISLYPTLFVNQAAHAMHAKYAGVCFGFSGVPSIWPGQQFSPWVGIADDGVRVWLGEPLIQWSLANVVDAAWATTAYGILKRFLAIASREIALIALGGFSVLNWSTNNAESIKTMFAGMKAHPNALLETGTQAVPLLHALMAQVSAQSESESPLIDPLLALANVLHKMGVGSAEAKQLTSLFSALRSARICGPDVS
jgi:hypothetical protein